MSTVKIKWISKIGEINPKTKRGYPKEMVDKLVENTKKLLPMPLYDFRDYVDEKYTALPLETQELLEKEPKCKIGTVKDISIENDNVFIEVETNDSEEDLENTTFSIAVQFDDEIDPPGSNTYGSYFIKRFFISDEELRGALIKKMIEKDIKNMPKEELEAIKDSKARLKKMMDSLPKYIRRKITKREKEKMKKLKKYFNTEK